MVARTAQQARERQLSTGLVAIVAATAAAALTLGVLDGNELTNLASAWVLVMAVHTAGIVVGWLIARVSDNYVANGCAVAWAARRSAHLKPFVRTDSPVDLRRTVDTALHIMRRFEPMLKRATHPKGLARLRDPPGGLETLKQFTADNKGTPVHPIIVAITVGLSAGVAVVLLWALMCNVLILGLSSAHDVLQIPLFITTAMLVGGFTLFRG